MKRHKTEILFFIIGLALFGYLVQQFGVTNIIGNIHKAGRTLIYAILIWFVIYLLNTVSWKLALGDEGKQIGFSYLFMVTVSGFILNYMTPVLSLGGEPYKVKKLSAAMGARNSLSAVVLYRMIHLLGHMLLLLTGIIAALIVLHLPATVVMPLSVAAVVISGVIFLTLMGNRYGVFRWFERTLARIPMFRKLSAMLAEYENELGEMDAALTHTFNNRRGTFYCSLSAEYLSRALMGVEMYFILSGIGVSVTPVSALFIYIMYSIVINLFFFIPLSIGTREGGIFLGLESLAITPLLSIYFGIVMRIREFFWILMGLIFILLTTDKHPKEAVSID